MKFITALLIAATFTLPVHAQSRTTREATYALLGSVKTVRTETAIVFKKDDEYLEGPRILSMTVAFREDGSRPELCLYDEKGSLARRIETRFEGKKQVEYLNYDGAGKMWLRGVHLYDADGRVRENATYHGDGSLRSKTVFVRNEKAQVIESAEYNARGTLLDKFTYTFNAAGELQTLERSQYRPTGLLLST